MITIILIYSPNKTQYRASAYSDLYNISRQQALSSDEFQGKKVLVSADNHVAFAVVLVWIWPRSSLVETKVILCKVQGPSHAVVFRC